MTPIELRAKRAQCIADSRKLLDNATAQGRDLNAEERLQFDRMHAEAHALKQQYERIENQNALESESAGRQTSANRPHVQEANGNPQAPIVLKMAGGFNVTLQPGTPAWNRCQTAYVKAFRGWLAGGNFDSNALEPGRISAAMQTDVGTAGGYLVLPEQFNAELIRQLNDIRWMRKLARVMPPTNAQSLGTPKRTAKMSSFAWGSELSTPNADSALKFGKRSLIPHYMTGEILVSRDLLRAAVLDPEAIVMFEIERDSGELEESAFLIGSGAQQPLGVFTASNDGIDTTRDVSTGNTPTTIGADNLRNVKYTIRAQYRNSPSIGWIFHRTAINQISTLKDGEGRYLWQNGVQLGDPDRLLNYPVYESEFAPSTFTTGQYVGLLGDFRQYWIADGLEMDLQRLLEKYAEQNQIAYLTRRKVDGAPMLADAFARVKLA